MFAMKPPLSTELSYLCRIKLGSGFSPSAKICSNLGGFTDALLDAGGNLELWIKVLLGVMRDGWLFYLVVFIFEAEFIL